MRKNKKINVAIEQFAMSNGHGPGSSLLASKLRRLLRRESQSFAASRVYVSERRSQFCSHHC